MTRGAPAARARFVASLRAEMALWSARGPGFDGAIDTIYLGGGTPSLLAPDQLALLIDTARTALPIAADAHVSMEANPEDVTPESLAAWRALGVRTLTLGVQSFDDTALRFLGRRHDGTQARAAVATALAAGFDSVGVDLIYGLPVQSPEAWRRDLESACALAPQHLSCYQLTVHAGTPFGFRAARGRMHEMPEPEQAELFALTHELLPARGWHAYEVSNFARGVEHRSRHNRKYWAHVPYLGLGPSAHSFDGGARWWNLRKVGPWERALTAGELPIEGREELGARELALEHLMLGLRTAEGVDLTRLAAFGVDLPAWNAALLERLADEGLLHRRDDHLVPTLAGWAVADGLAGAFSLSPEPALAG